MIRANLPKTALTGTHRRPSRSSAWAGWAVRELGYGSDADVMFVCEPASGVDDSRAVRWSSSIAEQVRELLGDSQRRPAAGDRRQPAARGPQPVRWSARWRAYAAYYEQWAQPWEIQALLRAHAVAGDADLGQRFLLMADKTRYPAGWRVGGGGARDPADQGPRRVRAAAARRRPATRTPSWAAGDWPTSNGPCSCCNCGTRTRSRPCTTPRRWNPWTRSPRPTWSPPMKCRPAAAGLADRHPGPQCAGAGPRQAHRPAARTGAPAQRGCGGRGLAAPTTAVNSWTTICG